MDDNPYQSPKSQPEVEKRPASFPSRYWTAAKKSFTVMALLTILLSVMTIIGRLATTGPSMGTLAPLGLVGIVVVVVAPIILFRATRRRR